MFEQAVINREAGYTCKAYKHGKLLNCYVLTEINEDC